MQEPVDGSTIDVLDRKEFALAADNSITGGYIEAAQTDDDNSTWLDNMLFDHFVNVASWTLSENAKVAAVYHNTVMELAPRHDHLKHTALSISGAHCVATLPNQSSPAVSENTIQALVERSMMHQSLALNRFVQAITAAKTTDLSQEESVAVTLSSIMILTSYIAQLQPAFRTFSSGDVSAISKAIALLNLQGPILGFFQQYERQIATSELSVFAQAYPLAHTPGDAHSPEAADSLARIALLCSAGHLPPDEQEQYAIVVNGLADLSHFIARDPGTIGGRFRWVIGDTAIYMANKIYQRSPEALLLLAHWAACQIPNPGSWWGSDFAEMLITEVEEALPRSHTAYLEWPLRQASLAKE